MYQCEEGVQLILASSSPRRKELLQNTGLSFEIIASSIDEAVLEAEGPKEMVERLAREKALHVASQYPRAWVLGADTTVSIRGEILGKPLDANDALRMLELLQGETHEVWSAFALVHGETKIVHVEALRSQVTMVPLSRAELLAYIETGESMDKAGAYAMQGKGAHLIHEMKGSYTNVVGLDISRVLSVLKHYCVIKVRESEL